MLGENLLEGFGFSTNKNTTIVTFFGSYAGQAVVKYLGEVLNS